MDSVERNSHGEGEALDDIINWFDEVSENADVVQRQTLKRIIELNKGAEYLQKWLGDIDVEKLDASEVQSLYTSLVPLTCCEGIEPYIQRIVDGDSSPVLTQQPIITLSLSSGTTDGRPKFVPFTSHSSITTLQIFRLAAAYRSRKYPIRKGGKILEFIYSSKESITKGGLKVGTATTHYFASEEFRVKQEKTQAFTCSPREVISSGDYRQSTYCHLLLGLHFLDQVEFITSTFAYTIVQAFRSFEHQWRELCNDLKNGTLNPKITSPKMQKSVTDIISPNPHLASWIEEHCNELEKMDWNGVIPKLWRNAKYVYAIMTGSMLPYLKKLRQYCGDLPLVSADYGSTESWIGANVDPSLPPEDVTFAVIPTFSYFEFIPLYRQEKIRDCSSTIHDYIEDKPVPLSQVKVGQEYEIVLTTFTGLYRYRLGDVVEVAGFHKGTPKLNFICRRKLILTVNIDKNTEKDLQSVVEKGSQILAMAGAELVDFTSHANVVDVPGHYTIYWEIDRDDDLEDDVLIDCCREMDASFVDPGYVLSRKSNCIGPLELCIVESGTFRKILEHYIGNGAAFSQFKTPRCINNQALLKILNASTIKKFRSHAYG